MLDLKAWAQDSPLYYARLRSAAVPNGVTRYGDEPLGGGSEDGQPPINIDALEASENEAVALWRALSHYEAETPYNPFMRHIRRKVVGLRMVDEPEFIVSCMADDVIDCVNLAGPGEVSPRTLTFCHKARSHSKMVVGDLTRAENDWDSMPAWVKSGVAVQYGVSYPLLHAWRSRGKVNFVRMNGEYLYCRDSLRAAVDALLSRRDSMA